MSLFDAASLESRVRATLKAADIPPDHRHAFVLAGTTAGGGEVKGVFATKVGDDWQLDSYLSVGKTAPLEAGVQFKGSW